MASQGYKHGGPSTIDSGAAGGFPPWAWLRRAGRGRGAWVTSPFSIHDASTFEYLIDPFLFKHLVDKSMFDLDPSGMDTGQITQ